MHQGYAYYREAVGKEVGVRLRLVYSGSQGGGCPTVYETDRGDLVVQGDRLTNREALGDLKDVLPGETAVVVPRSLLLEAVKRMGG
jgi:hypothetical protein